MASLVYWERLPLSTLLMAVLAAGVKTPRVWSFDAYWYAASWFWLAACLLNNIVGGSIHSIRGH